MRLLDRIFAEGFDSQKEDIDIEFMTGKLRAAQLVVIDNVAEYHFNDLKKIVGMKTSDFPNVMLPFECTFLEMRIHSKIEGVFEQFGLLADMLTLDSFLSIQPSNGGTSVSEDVWQGTKPAYILRGMMFAYNRKGQVQHNRPEMIASIGLPVNSEGEVLATNGNTFLGVGAVYAPDKKQQTEATRELLPFLMGTYIYPCLLALSFMHCRNIKTRTELPPPKLSKKHMKKTGQPLLRYRVLEIDPMKQVLDQEGRVSEQGLKKALHICRGHFKTYGKDGHGLLFGKHQTTVWIPMHTRGDIKQGAVVKDYAVKNGS